MKESHVVASKLKGNIEAKFDQKLIIYASVIGLVQCASRVKRSKKSQNSPETVYLF